MTIDLDLDLVLRRRRSRGRRRRLWRLRRRRTLLRTVGFVAALVARWQASTRRRACLAQRNGARPA